MNPTRRSFLGSAVGASARWPRRPADAGDDVRATYEKIDQAAAAPILNAELWPKPVKIASMEPLLQPAKLPCPGANNRRCRRHWRS